MTTLRTAPAARLARRMPRLRPRLWPGVAIAVAVCVVMWSPAPVLAQPAAPQTTATDVLFIGNSYTYFNNLGDIVAAIAEADPQGPRIVPGFQLRGGATLRSHIETKRADAIEAQAWDVVVLQEQSLLGGSIAGGKIVLGNNNQFEIAVRELAARVRARGASPVLYMTWARRDAPEIITGLARAYRDIGAELKIPVAPVGLAFAEAHRRLYTLDLITYDGSHPTAAGSYLAAAVIYATITGRDPRMAPATIYGRPISDEGVPDTRLRVPLVELPPATARALLQVAWDVVQAEQAAKP